MKLLALRLGLSVRLWHEQDAVEAFALIDANREHLGRWIPWTHSVRSAGDLREFILHHSAQHEAGHSWQYAIRQDDRLIGGVGLVRRSPFHVELGIWIAGDREGRGVATWACREMLSFAFERLSTEWVEICCVAGNLRTQTMAERLGFVWEESLKDASREDRWVYRCYGPRLRSLLDDTGSVRTQPRELALLPAYLHQPTGQDSQSSTRNI